MTEPATRRYVEQYLQEGLLALVPVYGEGGYTSAVLTLAGWHREPRAISWLVGRIAAFYSLDLVALRRRYGALLNLTRHISLALSDSLVLLPFTARQALVPGETTIGYLCMLQVEDIQSQPAGESAPWLSVVTFKGGRELGTLNTLDRLRQRLRQGETVRADYLIRQGQGSRFSGLNRRALLDQLPNCDCLLRDLFMERFGLDAPGSPEPRSPEKKS